MHIPLNYMGYVGHIFQRTAGGGWEGGEGVGRELNTCGSICHSLWLWRRTRMWEKSTALFKLKGYLGGGRGWNVFFIKSHKFLKHAEGNVETDFSISTIFKPIEDWSSRRIYVEIYWITSTEKFEHASAILQQESHDYLNNLLPLGPI